MVRIYGHSWAVRWGKLGEKSLVRVYSNCSTAELFLNGVSVGQKNRNSQDFPAAGLHWQLAFSPGKNHLRVVAQGADVTVTDEVDFDYETRPWGVPASLTLVELSREGNRITIEAKLHDKDGLRCLDSRKPVRFSLAGAGTLLDNLGTVRGSRLVQLANGRAQISIERRAECIVGVSTDGTAPAFLTLSAT